MYGLTADDAIPTEERAREALLMGLRLTEGIGIRQGGIRLDALLAALVN